MSYRYNRCKHLQNRACRPFPCLHTKEQHNSIYQPESAFKCILLLPQEPFGSLQHSHLENKQIDKLTCAVHQHTLVGQLAEMLVNKSGKITKLPRARV